MAAGLREKMTGRFIVLDGPDGCGKSTQVKMLAELIEKQGVSVRTYRDPGTTVIGEQIRDILLDPANKGMDDSVEVLLYMAARAQLWKERILPDLAAGRCVVMDRWISSTCAYQGLAGGFGIKKVIQLGLDCLDRVWPDVTVIIDIDQNTAAARMCRQLDRMEQKGAEYHKKVREGFLELATSLGGFFVVDGNASKENVHAEVIRVISHNI